MNENELEKREMERLQRSLQKKKTQPTTQPKWLILNNIMIFLSTLNIKSI